MVWAVGPAGAHSASTYCYLSDARQRVGSRKGWLSFLTYPLQAPGPQLKELGLTRSLEVGYELSPRGRSLLRHLDR